MMASGGSSPPTSGNVDKKRRLDGDRPPTILERVNYAAIPRVVNANDSPTVSNPDLSARVAVIERLVTELTQTVRSALPIPDSADDGDELDEPDEHVSDFDYDIADGQGDGDPLGDLAAVARAGHLRANTVNTPATSVTPPPTPGANAPPPSVLSDKTILEACSMSMLKDTLGREDEGKPVFDELADSLNKTLRLQPNHPVVHEMLEQLHYPSNVPKLKIPLMNEELLSAMPKGGKFLDTKLFRTSGLLAKCLVPILNLLTDIHGGNMRPLSEYYQDLFCTLRLSVANLNYLHQTRKDLCKLLINEPGLKKQCNWSSAIGDDFIFPFDMVKKVEEYRKAIKLGAPRRPRFFRGRPSFRGGRYYGRGRSSFRGSYPRSAPQSGRGRASTSK